MGGCFGVNTMGVVDKEVCEDEACLKLRVSRDMSLSKLRLKEGN